MKVSVMYFPQFVCYFCLRSRYFLLHFSNNFSFYSSPRWGHKSTTTTTTTNNNNNKGKAVPTYVLKAYGGSTGIPPLILNLGS